MEALAIDLIIGFSVDYVVHISNHYVESAYSDKFRRLQDSLTHMGVSIISGAFTSLSSTIPLFFAVIVFFSKIAALMLATIIFSIFFSMFMMASLILVFWTSRPLRRS